MLVYDCVASKNSVIAGQEKMSKVSMSLNALSVSCAVLHENKIVCIVLRWTRHSDVRALCTHIGSYSKLVRASAFSQESSGSTS